jgi:putative ABC transport system permease protein
MFSISVLFSFISISLNNQFSNSGIVDPMISSNIYAVTILVLIFACIFIVYSQNIFIKSRQRDYGILLTIGMTEIETRINILIENIVLCIFSLLGGLFLGTIFSIFFLIIVRNIVGLTEINISISFSMYKLTSIYILVIYSISLFVNIIGMIKSTIYDKLKSSDKSEKSIYQNMILLFLGLLFTISAFIIMIIFYHINSNIWGISLLLCIIGSLLFFFNGEILIDFFQTKYSKKYMKNIFFISDIKYYYGKNKKVFFATSWIFFAILFFTMFSLVTYPNFTQNAITYNPFHMAYCDINNRFEDLSNSEFMSIIENDNIEITLNEKVSFLRNNAITIFSVNDVNRIFKKNYSVESGKIIYVYPYDLNDGYEHDNKMDNSFIKINSKKFIIKENIDNPLFGKINCISEQIILVNDKDYNYIVSNNDDYISGILHLYKFNDWKKSETFINNIWNNLASKNDIKKNNKFYKISSRSESYNTAIKSSKFLIFNVIYASILLYFSAIIMIHFKLKMEYKTEKNKFYSLYRIGIDDKEIEKIISKKIFFVYFLSFIYSVTINIIYSYYTNSSYEYGYIGILCGIISTIIFTVIHSILYKIYFKWYYKKIISEF